MDPYLERSSLWADLQARLAYTISEVLQPVLPPPCFAQLRCRFETGRCRQKPDLTELHHDPIRHPFVEIRDARGGGRAVAVIEIVSPSDKARGPDREAYLRKQGEVLASDAHLVEVDLLRAGERLVVEPGVRAYLAGSGRDAHYVVLVSHAEERRAPTSQSRVYGFTVRDPLPRVELPLLRGDPPVALDLPLAFARAYDSGPYAKVVDYTGAPDPPLLADDLAWSRARIAAARA